MRISVQELQLQCLSIPFTFTDQRSNAFSSVIKFKLEHTAKFAIS